MLQSRRKARAMAQAVKTLDELRAMLDGIALSDTEREVGYLVYGRGWSLQQVAMHLGYSKRQISRMLAKVQDKIG